MLPHTYTDIVALRDFDENCRRQRRNKEMTSSYKAKVRHVIKEKYNSLYIMFQPSVWPVSNQEDGNLSFMKKLLNRKVLNRVEMGAVSLAPKFKLSFVFCLQTDSFSKFPDSRPPIVRVLDVDPLSLVTQPVTMFTGGGKVTTLLLYACTHNHIHTLLQLNMYN